MVCMFSPKKFIFFVSCSITSYIFSFPGFFSFLYKPIILIIAEKVKKKFLTSNSNGVIIMEDIVIKHNEVNHTLE